MDFNPLIPIGETIAVTNGGHQSKFIHVVIAVP
jgi:hypothetical protein